MEAIFFKLLILLLSLPIWIGPLAADAAAPSGNPRLMANEALTVSATRAREASAYVSRVSSGKSPRSGGPSALQDCAGMMAHSADRLQKAVEEMKALGQAGSPAYALRLSNVKTWASSALTDQDMCLDSLSRAGSGGLRDGVRKKVASVRLVTRNALSLVNRMN